MKKLGVFLFVFGATALFNRAELSSVDEGFIFNTTAALVEKQSFQMDEQLSGRKYSRFSPLPSLFAAPFYAVTDKVIEGPFPVGAAKKKDWLLFACGLSSCVLTAWTAVALLSLLRLLNYSEDTAVWTSLLWAFGTLAFPYSSSLFHQVIATVLMVQIVRFAFAEKIVGTSICTALLVSVQLTLAATVLPLFLRNRSQWNRRTLFGLSIGVIGGFGLHVATNWLRGDHWLHGAYETETFTTPMFVGTVGLFFSSGKGLLWFAPLAFVGLAMLLPFAHRRPEIGRPLLFAVTCHCLVVIHWWAWHGSLSWGPRLLLPILPLMMIPIADLIERRFEASSWQLRGVSSLAVVSIIINVLAATQPMIGFLGAIPQGAMSDWLYIPSLGPLHHPQAPRDFHSRFESTGQWQIASLVCIVLGTVLVRRWGRGTRASIDAAPWRSLACILIAGWCSLPEGQSYRMLLQRWNLQSQDGTDSGELYLPIRGTYRIEAPFITEGSIVVGRSTLSRDHREAFIEAPPMRVPVSFKTGASLWWTIPGEGVYRAPIPQHQFSSAKSAKQRSPWPFVASCVWLLYALAVVFYFDWLLGGRRMKEPRETGREASA